MEIESTLLMRKVSPAGAVKSSFDDFGFAVGEISWPSLQIKEPAKRSWPGEHGEDVYLPPEGLPLEAFNLDVNFLYKGEVGSARKAYTSLFRYLAGLDGDGVELALYDQYQRRGYMGVYINKIDDSDFFRTDVDESLCVKAEFRVTDPINTITLEYVGD